MSKNTYFMPKTMFQTQLDEIAEFNQFYAVGKKNLEIGREITFNQDQLAIREYLKRNPPRLLPQIFPYSSPPDLQHVPADLCYLAESLASKFEMATWEVLLAILATIGAAISGQYVVHVDKIWQEPVQLYVILAKNSGSMKSALLETLLKPIKARQKRLTDFSNDPQRQQCLKLTEEYNQLISNKKKKEFLKTIANSGWTNEDVAALIQKHVGDISEKLISVEQESNKIPFISNFTPSSLELLMSRHNAISICSMEDPFATCRLGDKSAVFQNLLLHGYGSESYHHPKRHGDVCIPEASISILATMTPETLLKYYNKEILHENGFLNRLLPCFMSDNKYLSEGANHAKRTNHDIGLLEDFYGKTEKLLDQRLAMGANRIITPLRLDEGAERRVREYRENLCAFPFDQRCKGFIAKHPGRAIRLAALLHGIRFELPKEHAISSTDMYTAISMCEALIPHACYALDKERRKLLIDAERVIRFIKEHPSPKVMVSTISKNLHGLPKDKLLPVLDILSDHEYLFKVVSPSGTPEWVVNPHIFPPQYRY